MSRSTLAVSQWILARLMPPAQADALIGDLIEELRLQAGSHVSVAGWYWRQLASSVPVLLWASVRRGAWLITVVTAVASFIAAFRIQMVLQSLFPMTTSKSMQGVIILLSFAAALAACGYVAASIRLGAARLLAFLVFAAVCAEIATSQGGALWYKGLFLVLGPLATIAGAALSGRLRRVRL